MPRSCTTRKVLVLYTTPFLSLPLPPSLASYIYILVSGEAVKSVMLLVASFSMISLVVGQ